MNLDDPIETLNLPVRAYNCLKRADIHTVRALCLNTRQDLRDLRNFGEKSVRTVEAELADRGLHLKPVTKGSTK